MKPPAEPPSGGPSTAFLIDIRGVHAKSLQSAQLLQSSSSTESHGKLCPVCQNRFRTGDSGQPTA
jgi:hypothetical protein